MNKRNWIIRLTTALLFMAVGFSAFAAGNKLTSSIPTLSSATPTLSSNTPNLTSNDSLLSASQGNTSKIYADVPNDYSIKYLSMLFGHVGGSLNGSITGQTIGHLFYIFNQGILIACGLWVLLTLVRILGKLIDGNVQEISKEGKSFLSICLGIVLVIPSPTTGYSTIQDVIMKVVVQGVKLANGIWNYQIDAFENHTHVFDNPPQQSYWDNSNEGTDTDSNGNSLSSKYQYQSIMTETIPEKINKGLYRMLNAEINYYTQEIECKANSGCGDSPHPLIAENSGTDANTSSITINQSYASDSAANPITFTASVTPRTPTTVTQNEDAPSGKHPFNSILDDAARAKLPEIAKAFACQKSPDSTVCSGVPSVDLSNSANIIIGLSTSFAESITNVYSIDELANDPVYDDNGEEKGQCKARWQTTLEYDPIEKKAYDDYLAQQAELAKLREETDKSFENNGVYDYFHGNRVGNNSPTRNGENYADGYQRMEDGSCGWDAYCTGPARDYMGVGDVGAWGTEDLASPVVSAADRLQNCMDWTKYGRDTDSDKVCVQYSNTAAGQTAKCIKYGNNSDTHIHSNDLNTGSTGEPMYPGMSDGQRKWMCQNYGSIMYQLWRTDERKLTDDQRTKIEDSMPSPAEIPDLPDTPPPYPSKIGADDTDARSCTSVLADKMRSSGWIMAGAYYWLIAHQDQKIATKTAKKDSFLDWSNGKKMYIALTAFAINGGGSDGDDGSSGSPGTPDAKNTTCTPSSEGATIDNLSACVLNHSRAQFRDNGTDIGQIDTMDASNNGISAQLAWAGNAFNSIVSGEAESMDSAPKSNGTSADSNELASTDNSMGDKAQSALGLLYKVQTDLYPQLKNQVYFLQKFVLNVAQQLNNPNLDPQSIIASIGIGMIYQGGYATLGYIHMMISLVITVLIGIVAIALLIMIPVAGASLAIIGGGSLAMLVSFVKIMSGMLKKIGVTFIAMGAVMAFYVPIYPWIVFTFAAVGWFIAVIEAMAAGPLICLGMTNPQGHELASSLKQSVMLLLSVFIRPALMIIAFIMSMILARVLLFFMIQGFLMLLGTLYDGNANDYCRYIFNEGTTSTPKCDGSYGTSVNLWNSMFNLSAHAADIGNTQYADTISYPTANVDSSGKISAGALGAFTPDAYRATRLHDGRPDAEGYQPVMQFLMMMLSMPVMLGVLTYMTYKIINHAYSLVFLVPENVLKWIGAQSAGNSQTLMQSADGSKEMAGRASKSGAKASDKTMQAGEAQATGAMKAGGSMGAKATGQVGSQAAKGKK